MSDEATQSSANAATESAIAAENASSAASIAAIETSVVIENAEASAGAAVVAEDAAAAALAAAAQAEQVADDAATREAAEVIVRTQTELEKCHAEIAALKEALTRMEVQGQSTQALLKKLNWLTELEEAASNPNLPATDGDMKDSDGGGDRTGSASADPEKHAPPEQEGSQEGHAAAAPAAGRQKQHRWL